MASLSNSGNDKSKIGSTGNAEDGLEFEVSEATDDQRDLAGGYRPSSDSESKADREPTTPPIRKVVAVLEEDEPIVENVVGSAGAMEEPVLSKTASSKAGIGDTTAPLKTTSSTSQSAVTGDKNTHKLSPAEVKAVEENLSKSRKYLDEHEQREIMKRINSPADLPSSHSTTTQATTLKHTHSVVPFDDEARPKMTDRARGVAYFFKNVIQLNSQQELHEQDVLSIGDRQYTLRKRRFSRQTMAIAFGSVFGVALLVAGITFMARSGSGKGWVTGMVLNEYDQPFIQGASVRFPDLGLTINSNGEGFFKSDAVPSGSHKVEYIVAGSVIGEDFVTVVGEQITNLVLRPRPPQEEAPVEEIAQPVQDESARPTQQTSSAGKVSLDAGVSGATLILNGKPVGAGNLTYANLTPGDYSYQVTKNGYQTAEGIVAVQAGQTTRIRVKLEPEVKIVTQSIPTPVRTSYDEGIAALTAGEFATARTSFSQAIADGIAVPSAYMGRAQGYAAEGAVNEAISDYMLAASAFGENNQLRDAVGAYNEALELDGRNVPALLGRGAIFMLSGEARAAAADYEAVTLVDKQNATGHIGLGDARLAMGDHARAQKHFKDARSLSKNDPYIYERLMVAYMGTNDFKEIRKTWDAYNKVATPDRAQDFLRDPANSMIERIVSTGG